MKPLTGLRILEFHGIGPVTLAGMILADMGAEVLRLTRADGGGPFDESGGEVLHRGRPSLAVDLKTDADRDQVRRLAASADAVIEGYRPGVMERLGLGPEALAAGNPRLVYGRVTGWGQTGPLAQQVGHDINYLSLTGVLHALGEPDRPPRPPLNLIGDYGGGAMMLVSGVLAGVLQARISGRGTVVDAAMTEGVGVLAALFPALASAGLWSEQRGRNLLDGGAPFYRCYACRDGRFVAVGALEPRFYAALLSGLGIDPAEAPQHDVACWPVLHDRFGAIFATRHRDDWAARFEGSEACVTPVLTFAEAARHPHNVARRAHALEGVVQPSPAPRFDDAVAEASSARPRLTLNEAIERWRQAAAV